MQVPPSNTGSAPWAGQANGSRFRGGGTGHSSTYSTGYSTPVNGGGGDKSAMPSSLGSWRLPADLSRLDITPLGLVRLPSLTSWPWLGTGAECHHDKAGESMRPTIGRGAGMEHRCRSRTAGHTVSATQHSSALLLPTSLSALLSAVQLFSYPL